MTTLTLVLFILLLPLCLFLIGLILLQGGAGDISSAFGGGGQLDSSLGVGAGRKMSKITGWLSGAFMTIVLLLSVQHAGDFGKTAGPSTAPAALPVTLDPLPTTPATHPVVTPAPEGAATTPATIAPVVPVVEKPVVPAPAPTAPAAEKPAAPAIQPVAPAPVAPAPVAPQPVAPAPAAEQPAPVAPAAEKPAEQPVAAPAVPAAPAAPRSGITLDEPAK